MENCGVLYYLITDLSLLGESLPMYCLNRHLNINLGNYMQEQLATNICARLCLEVSVVFPLDFFSAIAS